MQLKGKSKHYLCLAALAVVVLSACTSAEKKELTEAEKKEAMTIRKQRQRVYSDSMKRSNPLLIMPPDSEYTGDYIDKYPSGIIKFKGFFRFGQRHGDWFSFYPTGIKWSELTFDNGIKSGKNVSYYQNGKIRYEGYYKGDIQDSLWTYYDTTGSVVESFILRRGMISKKLVEANRNKN